MSSSSSSTTVTDTSSSPPVSNRSASASQSRIWSGGLRSTLGAEVSNPLLAWARRHTRTNNLNGEVVKDDPATRYSKSITYWDYIHPDILCSLQKGREEKGLNHHDEHMFILIHQTFELWFKQILLELEYIRDFLMGLPVDSKKEFSPLDRAIQRLHRADRILRLATEGYDIMETMDPQDFLEFRDFLVPSSGFQSIQFREMEILMGLQDSERIKMAGRDYREAFFANGIDRTGEFDRRLKEPTLRDALDHFLSSIPCPELSEFREAYLKCISRESAVKIRDIEDEIEMLQRIAEKCKDEKHDAEYISNLLNKAQSTLANARVGYDDVKNWLTEKGKYGQDIGKSRTVALIALTYNNHPRYSQYATLLNGVLRFEQGLILTRQRHARLVEYFIGRRPGTGGTSGVEYIDKTATVYRVFNDLARIRALQIARGKIPFDITVFHPIDPIAVHPARAALGEVHLSADDAENEQKKKSIAALTETISHHNNNEVPPPNHPNIPAHLLARGAGGCPFMAGSM